MTDLEELLRDAAGPDTTTFESSDIQRRVARRTLIRRGALSAACALVVVGGVTILATSASEDDRVDAVEQPDGIDEMGWTSLPPAPISPRQRAAATLSGDLFVVFSGEVEASRPVTTPGRTAGDGAILDLDSGEWTSLPAAHEAGVDAGLVWTGNEVVVWGGTQPEGGASDRGERLDPDTGRWRPLAPAPLAGRLAPQLTWLGGEVLVSGGWPGTGGPPGEAEVAAWNPATDTWRVITTLPARYQGAHQALVWDGRLIVWGGGPLRTTGAVVDPASGDVILLPPMPRAGAPVGSMATVDGDDLWVLGVVPDPMGEALPRLVAAHLDLREAGDGWRVVEGPETDLVEAGSAMSRAAAVIGGRIVLVMPTRQPGVAFDPRSGQWSDLPPMPGDERDESAIASDGGRIVLWSGETPMIDGEPAELPADGYLLTGGHDSSPDPSPSTSVPVTDSEVMSTDLPPGYVPVDSEWRERADAQLDSVRKRYGRRLGWIGSSGPAGLIIPVVGLTDEEEADIERRSPGGGEFDAVTTPVAELDLLALQALLREERLVDGSGISADGNDAVLLVDPIEPDRVWELVRDYLVETDLPDGASTNPEDYITLESMTFHQN